VGHRLCLDLHLDKSFRLPRDGEVTELLDPRIYRVGFRWDFWPRVPRRPDPRPGRFRAPPGFRAGSCPPATAPFRPGPRPACRPIPRLVPRPPSQSAVSLDTARRISITLSGRRPSCRPVRSRNAVRWRHCLTAFVQDR